MDSHIDLGKENKKIKKCIKDGHKEMANMDIQIDMLKAKLQMKEY